MKPVSLILLLLLLVAAPRASAQDPPGNPLPRLAAAAALAAADLAASADGPSQAVQPRPVQAPPPPPPPPVRSGSMIGYIDDATVGTKVRIRFDTGMHVDKPDRAEFFYAKCGCYQDLTDANKDPKAPGPRPDVAIDLNFQQFYVQAEYAVGPRVSILGELPLRWLQPQEFAGSAAGFSSSSGLGDLKTGAKFAVSSTNARVATVQVQLFLPSGDSEKGLGTNHASLEPAFLIYQRASERVVIEGELSVRFPLGGSDPVPITADGKFAGNVLFYGIGPSVEVYRSRGFSVSPVIELTGWSVLSGVVTTAPNNLFADASGTNIVNLKFGGRIGWKDYSSFYIGYGHALTDAKWYSDIVRFEYRYSF